METLPIIRVAMFGTRSTGKTNFLACLPALTESISSLKGCTLSIPDPETKALLAPLNDTLINGDVPDATKAQFPQSMRFILQRQLPDNEDKDYVRWYVDFFDYAGELLESLGYDDYNVPPQSDENSDEPAIVPTADPRYEKFKNDVKEHILRADAVLFFVPVDFDEQRSIEDQKKLRRIITDIIQPALSDTAKPMVFALTKWDKTDIDIEESQITDDLDCINSPSVEQFINSKEFFSLTYENAVKNLGKNVAVMPVSSYGKHNPDNKDRPKRDDLKPFNIIPMLYWICRQAEETKIIDVRRKLEKYKHWYPIFSQIASISACNTFLNDDTNNDENRIEISSARNSQFKRLIINVSVLLVVLFTAFVIISGAWTSSRYNKALRYISEPVEKITEENVKHGKDKMGKPAWIDGLWFGLKAKRQQFNDKVYQWDVHQLNSAVKKIQVCTDLDEKVKLIEDFEKRFNQKDFKNDEHKLFTTVSEEKVKAISALTQQKNETRLKVVSSKIEQLQDAIDRIEGVDFVKLNDLENKFWTDCPKNPEDTEEIREDFDRVKSIVYAYRLKHLKNLGQQIENAQLGKLQNILELIDKFEKTFTDSSKYNDEDRTIFTTVATIKGQTLSFLRERINEIPTEFPKTGSTIAERISNSSKRAAAYNELLAYVSENIQKNVFDQLNALISEEKKLQEKLATDPLFNAYANLSYDDSRLKGIVDFLDQFDNSEYRANPDYGDFLSQVQEEKNSLIQTHVSKMNTALRNFPIDDYEKGFQFLYNNAEEQEKIYNKYYLEIFPESIEEYSGIEPKLTDINTKKSDYKKGIEFDNDYAKLNNITEPDDVQDIIDNYIELKKYIPVKFGNLENKRDELIKIKDGKRKDELLAKLEGDVGNQKDYSKKWGLIKEFKQKNKELAENKRVTDLVDNVTKEWANDEWKQIKDDWDSLIKAPTSADVHSLLGKLRNYQNGNNHPDFPVQGDDGKYPSLVRMVTYLDALTQPRQLTITWTYSYVNGSKLDHNGFTRTEYINMAIKNGNTDVILGSLNNIYTKENGSLNLNATNTFNSSADIDKIKVTLTNKNTTWDSDSLPFLKKVIDNCNVGTISYDEGKSTSGNVHIIFTISGFPRL